MKPNTNWTHLHCLKLVSFKANFIGRWLVEADQADLGSGPTPRQTDQIRVLCGSLALHISLAV